MRVSRQFLKDFAYLANFYSWTPDDIEQIKNEIRSSPDLVRYWSVLAQAHQDGYRQTPENRYLRLTAWFDEQGCVNPFAIQREPP